MLPNLTDVREDQLIEYFRVSNVSYPSDGDIGDYEEYVAEFDKLCLGSCVSPDEEVNEIPLVDEELFLALRDAEVQRICFNSFSRSITLPQMLIYEYSFALAKLVAVHARNGMCFHTVVCPVSNVALLVAFRPKKLCFLLKHTMPEVAL